MCCGKEVVRLPQVFANSTEGTFKTGQSCFSSCNRRDVLVLGNVCPEQTPAAQTDHHVHTQAHYRFETSRFWFQSSVCLNCRTTQIVLFGFICPSGSSRYSWGEAKCSERSVSHNTNTTQNTTHLRAQSLLTSFIVLEFSRLFGDEKQEV